MHCAINTALLMHSSLTTVTTFSIRISSTDQPEGIVIYFLAKCFQTLRSLSLSLKLWSFPAWIASYYSLFLQSHCIPRAHAQGEANVFLSVYHPRRLLAQISPDLGIWETHNHDISVKMVEKLASLICFESFGKPHECVLLTTPITAAQLAMCAVLSDLLMRTT